VNTTFQTLPPPWPPPAPAHHFPPPLQVDGDLYERAAHFIPVACTSREADRPQSSPHPPPGPLSDSTGPVRLGTAYTKVWWATAISRTGDGITQAALPLLAAHITGDVRHVAWVYGTVRLPWLGMSLIAGALADRWNRRLMLLYADLSRLALLALLGAVALGGSVHIWMLYVVGFGLGSGEMFYESANAGVVPSIVHPNQYERASGRLSAATVATYDLIGPATGALLFSVGVGLPFLVDAATFFVASQLLFSLRNNFGDERSGPTSSTSLVHDIRSGLSWLWGQPTLRALALMTGAMNMALQCSFAPLAVFSSDVLGLADWGFGVMLAGASVGAIAGGVFSARIAGRLGPALTLRTAIIATAISLTIAGSLSNPVLAISALSMEGAALVLYETISVSTRMAAVPDHLRGRVTGAYLLLASFGGPIGAGLGGLLAHEVGLRAPFFVGAGLTVVILIAFASSLSDAKLRAVRRRIDLTDAPANAASASSLGE
jgi:MFS family permease